MKKKDKASGLPMSMGKKIVLCILAVAVLITVIYLTYYIIHYMCYSGYKKYLNPSGEYETGHELELIKESEPSVPGYSLVAENDLLKLYTDTKSANVAVYDKRNGSICYTNPVNADEDTIAKSANKNYLKSQLILSFYNAVAASAVMDSYSKSVKNNSFRVEGIENGLRYVYTIGEPNDIKTGNGIYFVVPLEYRLDGDSVLVSVPSKGIEEYGNGYIYRIQLLRYMGASTYTDNGYLVVPNGSGSIINFNNGKKGVAQYSQYIYGIDPLSANYTTLEEAKDAKLPIFGICYEDRTVFGEVEEGATTATLTAGVSGNYNERNYVYPTFVTRNADNLVMFGDAKNDTYVIEENLYDIDYTVRYSFLTSENAGYSGMANYYRNKLIGKGVLKEVEDSTDIPFYYDIISGVKETGHFLGVQYLHTFSMTDFDEAAEIADTLSKQGIKNQVMNLQGWFNGGYYHDATDHLRVLGKLGGKSGLSKLNTHMKELGGRLYGDVAFQKVTYADDSFNYNAESSRYYGGGYVAAFGLNDPSTLRNTASLGFNETRYNMLSPKFLPRYVEKFAKKVMNIDIDGISLRDLGNTLQSDKKRTNITDREQALAIVMGQYEQLKATGKELLFDSPNSYAFGYAKDMINVPFDANQYFICDDYIPLYQMIVHGCINYSSILLNYENSYELQHRMLQMIESGTAPHYQFTYEEASRMKNTGLNRFYSTTFATHVEEASSVYAYVNEALRNVINAQIICHEIDGNIRKVTYSNGVVFYINYGDEAGEKDAVSIPAMSYRMEGN